MEIDLSSLPDQKYFTMGEASEILSVKDHVLRYWEKSFKKYFSVKRISNRRMFQKGDLIKVRPKTEEEKEQSLLRNFIDTVKEELHSMMELIR